MHLPRTRLAIKLVIAALLFSPACSRSHAQAAMLMEEPFGFFGFLNPTGHDAMYFARICAETPVKLRRCAPGELGAVITRYQGIAHYDWLATPLLPYLYSVETASGVPTRVNHDGVIRLRDKYHDDRLQMLGKEVPRGGDRKRGWSQMVGAAYDRRIYAFRFATTEEQDDALIARLNSSENRSSLQFAYSQLRRLDSRHPEFLFPRHVPQEHPSRWGDYHSQADQLQARARRAQAPGIALDGVRYSTGSWQSPPQSCE